MHTAKWPAVIAAVLVGGLGTAPRAENQAAARLVIDVLADPGVPSPTVAAAKAVVDRVYQGIGVEITWVDGAGPSPVVEVNMHAVWRRIWVKSTAERHFPAAYGNVNVLGVAPRGNGVPGRVAYVFYDAALVKAQRHAIALASVLGYAMAHELGHLLLPRESHGTNGVMRGDWLTSDLRLMREEKLAFDRRDGVEIRAVLLSGDGSK